MEHALLSASSASRWLNCTAAPRYEEQFPETTSEYAEEGRLAHALCELKVLKKFTAALNQRTYTTRLNKLKKEPLYAEEMDRTSDLYLDCLTEQTMWYTTPPLVNAEVRVDLTEYIPEGFGTCDCVMIGGDTLAITDYKHGKGVPVLAEGNAQLRLYALGALKMYEPFYGGAIQRVRMTIYQPRLQEYPSDETLTVDALKAWGETVKPIAQLAFSGFGEFKPGSHCQFCRGKAQCRARAAENSALEDFKDFLLPTPENLIKASNPAPPIRANGETSLPAPPIRANGETSLPAPPEGVNGETNPPAPSILTNGEIGDLLTRGKYLVAWFNDLEEFALGAILRGETIPGWKAVAGRSNRTFTDHDAAAAAVIAAGYDEALVYERKPKTLTALEGLMGKVDFAEKLGAYVFKPPGKPALAPLSDKREPYNSAASDFAGASTLDGSTQGAPPPGETKS